MFENTYKIIKIRKEKLTSDAKLYRKNYKQIRKKNQKKKLIYIINRNRA